MLSSNPSFDKAHTSTQAGTHEIIFNIGGIDLGVRGRRREPVCDAH
jgi:hypothetical protein